jgi:hypothetical protein
MTALVAGRGGHGGLLGGVARSSECVSIPPALGVDTLTDMETSRGAGGDALSSEDVEDAIDILNDVLQWELTTARWEQVDRLIEALGLALAADDRDTFVAALTELELLGPVRATRLGATPVVPAPAPIRERANRLVHELPTASTSPRRTVDEPPGR